MTDERVARAADAWLDEFFAHYYARRPVNATFIGVHEYDATLPDCSPTGLATTAREMRELRAQLAEIPLDELDDVRRIDVTLADGFLELQLGEDMAPQFHRGNPSYYTGEAAFSVIGLFQRDSEPLGDRVAAAIARMKLIPELLARSRDNIEAAPLAWTERAIREARAGQIYFGEGLRLLTAERGIADPAFRNAADIAHQAFIQHLAWLEDVLLQRPSEDYAVGRKAFDRYLARGHCLPSERDAAWVEAYARQSLADARDRVIAHAETVDATQTWRQLLARLPEDHPTLADYYSAYSTIWREAKAAAEAHQLVTWPDFPIEYVPIPPSDREAAAGLYYLFYRCPPPFGRPETHRYLVTPVMPEMPPEEQERRLRAANYATIKLNHVVHHGGLGHHVQNYNAFRAPSRIGQIAGVDCASRIALFCGGTLVEGWACYATELMEEIGYLTPLEILSERQTRLRMAARAVVDCALHTESMTLAEAATFYEHEAGMTPAAAQAEAVKNSLFPGAAAMYLIGTDGIWDIRHAVGTQQGSDFSLKAFHDRLLSFGAIPVPLIGQLMTAAD